MIFGSCVAFSMPLMKEGGRALTFLQSNCWVVVSIAGVLSVNSKIYPGMLAA